MKVKHIACLLILSGCANNNGAWYKANSSQEEYAKTKYLCLQESQQQQSLSIFSYNYQEGKSEMITNDILFGACMNAKGFYWQTKEKPK